MSKDYCNRIWGASDDLLEIDGALIEDEISMPDRPYRITCSDGTKAVFEYSEKCEWKCAVLNKGALFMECIECIGEDKEYTYGNAIGCTPYSDVLVIREPLAWIRVNNMYFRPNLNKK